MGEASSEQYPEEITYSEAIRLGLCIPLGDHRSALEAIATRDGGIERCAWVEPNKSKWGTFEGICFLPVRHDGPHCVMHRVDSQDSRAESINASATRSAQVISAQVASAAQVMRDAQAMKETVERLKAQLAAPKQPDQYILSSDSLRALSELTRKAMKQGGPVNKEGQ